MNENVLWDYKLELERHCDLAKELLAHWENIDKLYSYIISIDDKIIVKYMIAANPKYNTIYPKIAIEKIKALNVSDIEKGVLSFEQAPLDLYIEMHEPMIDKMARRIMTQWSRLEYDDLCQICRLCCVELYNKGYYLHKRLVWTTFKNKVIEEIRTLKKRGTVISIFDKSTDNTNSDDKDLTIGDSLIDWESFYKEEDKENLNAELLIFEEVKVIIIELIGERQFDMLFRDYANKHTTTTSRKLLLKVRDHLNNLGLSRNDFNKKYH